MIAIHHLTTLSNFEQILDCGCLKPRNNLPENSFCDTANHDIIESRDNLNNYVPFHLNIMEREWGISYNREVQLKNNDKDHIYLISKIDEMKFKNYNCLAYVYHPISTSHYTCDSAKKYIESLSKELNKHSDEDDRLDFKDPDVQHLFMSEILIKDEYPLSEINQIFVRDNDTKIKIEQLLKDNDFSTSVNIWRKKNFFY